MVDQIDIAKIMEQESKPEGAGYSALPGVVRELIRTQGFKELLLIHLRDINPENARELVKAAIWEDVAFSMSVIGASPKLINSLAEALVELGVQLNNFTLEILRDFLAKMGQDLDVETLKSIPAAYAPLVNDLLLNDREALDGLIAGIGSLADEMIQAAERTWRKIWNTADFGKIRVGLTEHLEGRRAELAGESEIFNPVAISNLLGVVPPLANYLLRVLTRTMQALDLPSEILANAIFQLLEDIDQKELGGLVNALTYFVNSLHKGNLLLGRDEPRFKEVAFRVSKDMVENVDGEQLKAAALALGEDGKVIGEVISSYLFATPQSTVEVVKAMHTALNAALRTVAETTRRLSELPADAVAELAEDYKNRFEAKDLGRILNYQALMFNKLCEQNPDMLSEILVKTLSAVDNEVWAAASKTAVLQVRDAVAATPQITAALEPEAIGRNINNGLSTFNKWHLENPGLVEEKIMATLAVVDASALSRAMEGVLTPLMVAIAKNRPVLKAMAKSLAVSSIKAVGAFVTSLGVFKRFRK
jgi:hypothetical protein